MTDSNDSKKASPQPTVTPPLPPNTPFTPYEAQPKRGGGAGTVLLWLVIVILAVAAGAGGFLLNRKFERADQQFAQRLQAADDARPPSCARKPIRPRVPTGALNTQIIQLQGKLTDAETHSQALQQQYQDLASNRDDWTSPKSSRFSRARASSCS